jgi:hypothetical protein
MTLKHQARSHQFLYWASCLYNGVLINSSDRMRDNMNGLKPYASDNSPVS